MKTSIAIMAIICLSANVATAQFTTTESGLMYNILKPGNGKHPQNGYRVWIEYTGWLDDSTVFSSTDEYGNVDVWMGHGQITKGWEEALPLVGEGGEMQIVVPPHLGYGDNEVNGIPRNSTLHFDIKVIQVDSCAPIAPYDIKNAEPHKLANGITYYTIDHGHGNCAKAGDNVYIHYTGWLPDGAIYTTTRQSANALRFTAGVGETFAGLDTALMLMSEGAKCRFVIPGDMAYGDKGYSNRIPPHSDLTLDIEMVRISPGIHVEKWDATGHDTLSTASGLRYIIIEQGEGPLIEADNIVTAHYSGYFTNGQLFDSSVKREEPIKYPVGAGLILDGWNEASLLMRKGSRFQLLVPSHLAYGEEGLPPTIPANADLIFDVEILDVIE